MRTRLTKVSIFIMLGMLAAFGAIADTSARISFLFVQPNATAPATITGILPLAHNASWTSVLGADNATAHDVTIATTNINVGPVPSVSIPPGGTRFVNLCAHAGDCFLDSNGFAALTITYPQGVDVVGSYDYSFTDAHRSTTTSHFDIPPLVDSDKLAHLGDSGYFDLAKVDTATVTILTTVNFGPPAYQTLTFTDSNGHFLASQYCMPPAGISQCSVLTPMLDGGRVYITLGVPGIGPQPDGQNQYVFATVGPANGNTQRFSRLKPTPTATVTAIRKAAGFDTR